MKEIDPTSVAVFQEGKLRAFGKITSYTETDSAFNSTIKVEKGTLLTGEHQCNIAREYDVCVDGIGTTPN